MKVEELGESAEWGTRIVPEVAVGEAVDFFKERIRVAVEERVGTRFKGPGGSFPAATLRRWHEGQRDVMAVRTFSRLTELVAAKYGVPVEELRRRLTEVE